MATKTTPRASKPIPKAKPSATPMPAARASLAPAARPARNGKPAPDRVLVKGTEQLAQAKEASAGKVGNKAVRPRMTLVRDSFTMPEADFALIAELKSTALVAQRAAKKSELLRAGLQLLSGLDAESLVVVLDRLEAVKTGRPKKGH